jgi:predicted ester cyclase/ketosteroid isomerase-like protein
MTTPADRLARVRDLIAAFNRHDVAGVVEHLSATVIRSRGDGTSIRGRDEAAARLRTLFELFPDASLTPTHTLAIEPDVVVAEWFMDATYPTGRAVRIVGADLFGFNAAGEIESAEARVDTAALVDQVSSPPRALPAPVQVKVLAKRYTAAWCSRNASRVADYYAANGSLRVNGGLPAVGRRAITEVAQGFMTAFPDMRVLMDGLLVHHDRAVYVWTLAGTNTGPGGTGRKVRISGFEVWQIGEDGLIAESRGYFDSAAYRSQLERGVDDSAS